MAQVRTLRNELAEEQKLRGKLEDEMVAEMAQEKQLRGKLGNQIAEERNIRGQDIAALTDLAVVNKNMIQTLITQSTTCS